MTRRRPHLIPTLAFTGMTGVFALAMINRAVIPLIVTATGLVVTAWLLGRDQGYAEVIAKRDEKDAAVPSILKAAEKEGKS